MYKLRELLLFALGFTLGSVVLEIIMSFLIDGYVDLSQISLNSFDLMIMIYMFIFALVFSTDIFNTSAQNGTSKKTTVCALLASVLTTSAAMSLGISLLLPMFAAISGTPEEWFLEYEYGFIADRIATGSSAAAVRIEMFLLLTVICASLFMIGTVISAFVYRFKPVVVAITAAVIVAIPIALAVIDTDIAAYIFGNGYIFISGLYGLELGPDGMLGDLWKGIGMNLADIAVFAFVTWLFIRRAAVKPLPIRSNG